MIHGSPCNVANARFVYEANEYAVIDMRTNDKIINFTGYLAQSHIEIELGYLAQDILNDDNNSLPVGPTQPRPRYFLRMWRGNPLNDCFGYVRLIGIFDAHYPHPTEGMLVVNELGEDPHDNAVTIAATRAVARGLNKIAYNWALQTRE